MARGLRTSQTTLCAWKFITSRIGEKTRSTEASCLSEIDVENSTKNWMKVGAKVTVRKP